VYSTNFRAVLSPCTGVCQLDERGLCPACGLAPEPADVVSRPSRRRSARDDRVARELREPRRLLVPIG